MAENQGDRRYEATARKRQQAREQGQLPRSRDLASALVLVGGLLVLWVIGEASSGQLVAFLRAQLGDEAWLQADRQFVVSIWSQFLMVLVASVLPLVSLTLLVALVANVMQTGWLFVPQRLAPDLSRLSPLKGIGRLVALTNFVRLGFGIFKVLVVAAVAGWALWGERETLSTLAVYDVATVLSYVCRLILWTSMKIGVALLVLALLDYAFQRWKHDQDLRMTEQEMRDELKTTHGDPQVVARRRAIQRQMVMSRINSSVPSADVVVTNPTELAVAIRYEPAQMAAPIVVAKGAGALAQRIRRLALENNVPIVERKELAQVLYRDVELQQEIPPEQYAAVAEVLKYVYELRGRSLPDLDPSGHS